MNEISQRWTKERAAEWQRNWRLANRGRINAYSARERRSNPKHRAGDIVGQARIRAKRKGLTFDITVEWVRERLERGVCELTGQRFNLEASGCPSPFSPSIDRRDNLRGYTQDNCQLVLHCLNSAFGYWGREVTAMVMKIWLERSNP